MLVGIRNAAAWVIYGSEKPGGLPFEMHNRTRPREESVTPALRNLTRIYRYLALTNVDLKLTDLTRGKFMLSPIRRFSVVGVVILAGILVLSGCASRKYVRLQTQALEPAIQEAQNGVKENAERIDAVDRRAQQGVTAAGAADTKATAAQRDAAAAATAAQAA